MRVVNCDRGQNIAEVLARAEPGDTIRVTGTCVEPVSIKTDRITLDGQGASAVLKGAIRTNKEDESTILLLQLRFATHVS